MTRYISCEAADCDEVTAWGSDDWISKWIEVERAEVKVDLCSWECAVSYAEEMIP